jgi:hypothetical protein
VCACPGFQAHLQDFFFASESLPSLSFRRAEAAVKAETERKEKEKQPKIETSKQPETEEQQQKWLPLTIVPSQSFRQV